MQWPFSCFFFLIKGLVEKLNFKDTPWEATRLQSDSNINCLKRGCRIFSLLQSTTTTTTTTPTAAAAAAAAATAAAAPAPAPATTT